MFFAPFAAVTSPAGMVSAIRDTLSLADPRKADPKKQLLEYLSEKTMLLVLDNLEQLLGGTPFIRELIDNCPRLTLLITSRERLNLESEWVFTIEGLAYPQEAVTVERAESFDAVQLFVQRAGQTQHGFTLTGETLPAVVRICELVDGMPLALVLAASWLHVLPLSRIVEQLEEGVGLLEGSKRDLPARHRSIRAVFDRSWDLLSEVERKSLGRLSVFRGGFSLEAAKEVAGATLPILASLANKSLVTLSPTGRYVQHPLLLEYARERFSERPEERADTEEKHGVYYLSFLEEHYRELSSSRINEVRELLSAELPNIMAAWVWAADNLKLERLKNSAFPLYLVFDVEERGVETWELFSRAVDRLDEENPEHQAVLGYLLIGQNKDVLRGVELLRPLGEDLGLAWGLSILVISRILAGDVPLARAIPCIEGLPYREESGERLPSRSLPRSRNHVGESRSVGKQR